MILPRWCLSGPCFLLGLSALALPAAAPPQRPGVTADHARAMQAGRELFASQIRPLLTARCARCHGGGRKRGGLNLTTRDGVLKGGDGGPAVVPGKSRSSRLYRAVAHLAEPHMPPKGRSE